VSDLASAEFVMVRFGEIEDAILVRARPAPLCGADGSVLGEVRGARIGGRFAAEFLDNRGRRCCAAFRVWPPGLDEHENQRLRVLSVRHGANIFGSWQVTGESDDPIAYVLPGGPPEMDRRSRRIEYRVTLSLFPVGPPVALVDGLDITTVEGELVTRIGVHRGGWRKDVGYGIEHMPSADDLHRRLGLAVAWIDRDRWRYSPD